MKSISIGGAIALVASSVAGCGDDMAQVGSGGDGSGAFGGYGGAGAYGGYGGSGAYGPVGPGVGGGSAEGGGAPAPAPIAPPPEPEECDGLDPSQPLVLYVSADDSNSMASPARAREALEEGSSLVGSIRTYEFFNYYRFDYPAPVTARAALFAEATNGSEPGAIDLQFAVRAVDAPAVRRPMTLTFVLDTSGSMSGSGILRERAAILALASKLQDGDVVNAVTWSTSQNVLLSNHVASGPNDAVLVTLAQNLEASGGTDLNAGLVKGYDLALESYDPDRLNRLVLISDGGANVGVTDKELIAEHSELNDEEGIYLVGIHTGGSGGDELMDTVTDEGRGAYVYLDKPSEAQEILGNRFDEVMEVAARGVQLELTVPWYFQMQKFYGEEYSEDPTAVKPQHLAPGDTMVLLQTLRACDASLLVGSDPITIVASWNTPVLHEPESVTLTTTVEALLAAPAPRMPKGKAIAAYADALKAGSAAELSVAWGQVVGANVSGTDADLSEIQDLIEKHPAYQP